MTDLLTPEMLEEIRVNVIPPEISESATAIYAVGGMTAGLKTPQSDIDLYVFGDTNFDYPVMGRIEGTRVDLEVRTDDWLSVQLGHFMNTDVHFLDMVSRPTAHHDTLARFWYAKPVLPSAEFEILLGKFRARPEYCAKILASEQLLLAVNAHDDLLGFMADNDVRCAVPTARRLLNHSVQALLCSSYAFYLGDKWIPRKLSMLRESRPEDEALAFADNALDLAMAGTDPRRMLSDAQCVSAIALIRVLEGNPEAAARIDTSANRNRNCLPAAFDWTTGGLARANGREIRMSADAIRIWLDPAINAEARDKLMSIGALR